MLQVSQAIPAGAPVCVTGHRPQLVESRGAPFGHRLGSPCPSQWHVECAQCAIATVPVFNRPAALRAWCGKPDLFHIPLSLLGQVRAHVVNAAAAA